MNNNEDITKLLASFFANNYTPIGSTEDKVLKTSEELVYDMQEFITISPSTLSVFMDGAGFKVTFISGRPYWILYERV